ncbi:3-methyladenine DNA glycosylase [Subtercola boreus]|uniref:3-methyladenine DNA glycosylase n=1 Tax=Subtercola boreus TaxID=120213 RepID=A0A3E0VG63_9MICO|nr:DNA-3-methyladenine glycosylase 2 family protein [Subtercola boreus]RFA07857.1 3-methyladenine DNA glycosylase [Subtercola boreus]TQL55292.1 3-methyladenine DNA glycosylase/8-oxoguanine DNA glycosylase [Subtercola boreus]
MDALLADPRPLTSAYAPARPVNLRQTVGPLLRGQQEPTMRFTPNGFWRVIRTPEGTATLHAETRSGDGQVHATAWGAGAEWVLDALPELLGAGDDWSGLDLSRVPPLAEVRRQHPGLWLTSTALVFESLVPTILEQKVTTIEARRAWRYLVGKYGEIPPGPAPEGMRVQPSPRQWALIPSWEWHRAGVGPNRSRAVLAAAAVAAGLDRLAQRAGAGGTGAVDVSGERGGLAGEAAGVSARPARTHEGVLEKLQTVHGVGAWTAAETSQRSHGHPDAVSVGDFHLAAHVGWVLIGEPVDDDGMLELLEPWRGHRQRVVRLILASGVPKPKFGPRATIQDHRWH